MKLVLAALWATLVLAEGYKILCVFPVPTRSHNALGKGVVRSLLQAGHSVWWATPYPELVKEPVENLTLIDVSATIAVYASRNMSDMRNSGFLGNLPLATEIVTIAAQAPDVVRAMLSQQFDAVVTEWFVSDVPAGYAAVQQAPWIVLSSVGVHPYLEYLVDDVTSTAILPVVFNKGSMPMDYWQRLLNSFVIDAMELGSWVMLHLRSDLYFELFGLMAATRGTVLPPLTAVYNNVSILLVNSHPVIAPAQSLPPNVVYIAGYHIEEDELPKDLQELLDSSTQGAVYFSMGSVVKMSTLPASLKTDLAAMFGELPYTVLWQSDEPMAGLPKNVLVRSWLPQTAVLAHPNIKLFITHAGLLSIIEAIHFGVPLLAVPVFADQPINAERAVSAGYATSVDFHQGMAPEIRAELNYISSFVLEISKDHNYYKTAKHLSKLFHNRPVAPSKLISHYVELAIETRGAYHLRSGARHYSWLQLRRVDQLLGCLVFLYSLYIACKMAARGLRGLAKRKRD